jgi:hypothetical protein
LTALGLQHDTDKASHHGFTDFYDAHLRARRDEVGSVLEVGVWRGASLRMWRDYFRTSQVYGIDANPVPVALASEGFLIARANAGSRDQLRRVLSDWGTPGFDLIVDDGGHRIPEQLIALDTLWPHLTAGGVYIIEDLHTSLTPADYGGRTGCMTTLDLVRVLAGETAWPAGRLLPEGIMLRSEFHESVAAAYVYETRGGKSITSLIVKRSA